MEDYYSNRCNNCSSVIHWFENNINLKNKRFFFCSLTCCSSYDLKNLDMKLNRNECLIKTIKIIKTINF